MTETNVVRDPTPLQAECTIGHLAWILPAIAQFGRFG